MLFNDVKSGYRSINKMIKLYCSLKGFWFNDFIVDLK